MIRSRPIILAALFLLSVGAPLAAYGQAASLTGQVIDASTGDPVAEAAVHLVGSADSLAVLTASDGSWRTEALPAGEYRVRVQRIGYGERRLTLLNPRSDDSPFVIGLTPNALPLDAMVVTASRRLQRLADTPVTTELITRRDIEATRIPDLSTLLTQRLGVQLQAGHPAGEGVVLQGLGSERVLVLLDGQPLVGRLSGTLDVSRIPTSVIERVEVVKGSQSSLYGSDAMGGVINIITRNGGSERWQLALDATTGSQGRMDFAGSLGGAVGAVDYLVDAGRRTTDIAPGIEVQQGALSERWDGMAKIGWNASEDLRFEGSGLLLDERQRWRVGQLYQFADNVQRDARINAAWSPGAHRISPSLHWTEFEHLARRGIVATPAAGTGEAERQRLYEAEILYNFDHSAFVVDAGVEAKREEIASDRVEGANRSMHTVEPFAQATLLLGDLHLVPGGRVTWSEEWGAHFTPRVAALYRPVPQIALRGSVGRGYRAPSFKELYMEFLNVGPGFSYTVRGNPALQPESSTNVTLGIEWTPGNGYLRTQLFETRFDEFIETTLAGDSSGLDIYSYANISEGVTRGFEVEGGIAHGPVRLEAGYAFLHSRAVDTGDQLLGSPRHSGRAAFESALPFGLRAGVTGIYTGPTPIQRGEMDVVERGSFLRFDGNVSTGLPAGLRLTAGVRNLFDARPAHWPGLTGRHLFIGIGWDLARSDMPWHPAD